MAEAVGFEPTVSFPTHDFQSCRFGRSRTPPDGRPPLDGPGVADSPDRLLRHDVLLVPAATNIAPRPDVGCDGWVLRNVLL
jgi:hypothetical protein